MSHTLVLARRRNSRRRNAFTLIEVLLVLAILVMLGSLAVGAYTTIQQRSNVNIAKTQVAALKTQVDAYFTALNQFPPDLQALIVAPADLPNPAKWMKFSDANEIPLDPWGMAYQYASPGRNNPDSVDIWSMGPDRADGTEDDIGNWNLAK